MKTTRRGFFGWLASTLGIVALGRRAAPPKPIHLRFTGSHAVPLCWTAEGPYETERFGSTEPKFERLDMTLHVLDQHGREIVRKV